MIYEIRMKFLNDWKFVYEFENWWMQLWWSWIEEKERLNEHGFEMVIEYMKLNVVWICHVLEVYGFKMDMNMKFGIDLV